MDFDLNKPEGAVDYSGNGEFKFFLRRLGYASL